MKRVLLLFLTLLVVGLAFSPLFSGGQGHAQRADKGKFRRNQKAIPNQYVVVLKDEVPAPDVPSVASQLASAHGGVTRFIYQHALKGFSIQLSEAAAIALSKNPQVDYVAEDGQASTTITQFNPPSWGLDRIDQQNLPLNNAYNYNFAGGGVHVYVIDTGISPAKTG